MEGYVLLSKEGWKLTRSLMWSAEENAGWIWSWAEVSFIVESWNGPYPPAYYQYAQLIWNNDHTDNWVDALGNVQRI